MFAGISHGKLDADNHPLVVHRRHADLQRLLDRRPLIGADIDPGPEQCLVNAFVVAPVRALLHPRHAAQPCRDVLGRGTTLCERRSAREDRRIDHRESFDHSKGCDLEALVDLSQCIGLHGDIAQRLADRSFGDEQHRDDAGLERDDRIHRDLHGFLEHTRRRDNDCDRSVSLLNNPK